MKWYLLVAHDNQSDNVTIFSYDSLTPRWHGRGVSSKYSQRGVNFRIVQLSYKIPGSIFEGNLPWVSTEGYNTSMLVFT